MITIGFQGFTPWELQLGHGAGGPANSAPCIVAEALAEVWTGPMHSKMGSQMTVVSEVASEVVIFDAGAADPIGSALTYWDRSDRLEKIIGFVPVNDWFIQRLLDDGNTDWTLRLGFERDWDSLNEGDVDDFRDMRGHPARFASDAHVLMVKSTGDV